MWESTLDLVRQTLIGVGSFERLLQGKNNADPRESRFIGSFFSFFFPCIRWLEVGDRDSPVSGTSESATPV